MSAQTLGSMETMKATVYRRYGLPDVLAVQDVAKPVPKVDEVLVHVHAVSGYPLDWHLLRGEPYFARVDMGLGRRDGASRASTWPDASRRSAGT